MAYLRGFACVLGSNEKSFSDCFVAYELRSFSSFWFCSLVAQHPRQARQIKAKEAEIIGLWNGLKVSNNTFSNILSDQQ